MTTTYSDTYKLSSERLEGSALLVDRVPYFLRILSQRDPHCHHGRFAEP